MKYEQLRPPDHETADVVQRIVDGLDDACRAIEPLLEGPHGELMQDALDGMCNAAGYLRNVVARMRGGYDYP